VWDAGGELSCRMCLRVPHRIHGGCTGDALSYVGSLVLGDCLSRSGGFALGSMIIPRPSVDEPILCPKSGLCCGLRSAESPDDAASSDPVVGLRPTGPPDDAAMYIEFKNIVSFHKNHWSVYIIKKSKRGEENGEEFSVDFIIVILRCVSPNSLGG
jgi:hypothetical protein